MESRPKLPTGPPEAKKLPDVVQLVERWKQLGADISDSQKKVARDERERDEIAIVIASMLKTHNDVPLSPREFEVMEVFCGPPMQCNKEIAAKLNISTRTVKFHLSNMLAKFKVENRYDLYLRYKHLHEAGTGAGEKAAAAPIS